MHIAEIQLDRNKIACKSAYNIGNQYPLIEHLHKYSNRAVNCSYYDQLSHIVLKIL